MPPHVRTDRLPTRNYVFEFELARSERGDGLQALNVELVSSMSDRPSAGGFDEQRPPRRSHHDGPSDQEDDYDDYDDSEDFDDEYDVEDDADYEDDDYDNES